MAYTTIDKSSLHFNTVQWTGNASTNAITGVGFRPDWIWGKSHTSGYSHQLYDVVRGATYSLKTNGYTAQETLSTGLTSFDSDGFTLGSNTNINASGHTVTGWNWKANGSGVSNTDGSITSTVSANTTAGFSIVTYTGTGSAATVGHGLGSAPSVIIQKKTSASATWLVKHPGIGTNGYIRLDATNASATDSAVWNSTDPTSTVFSIGTDATINGSGATSVAYCFTPVKGFSKFGSYTGNGNADGTFIYTGFKVSWLLLKMSSGVQGWFLVDNKRANPYNPVDGSLHPNASAAEDTASDFFVDFTSNGFKLRNNDAQLNGSGSTYIYMAFAEHPLVSSNDIPATAR